MVVKTYRGRLAEGGQDRIPLATKDGSVGYRIAKLAVMGPDGSEAIDSVLKIYKEEQSAVDNIINFTDNSLLAAAVISQSSAATNYPEDVSVIFDQEIFNQDIYITLKGAGQSAKVNYYIELEQMKLDHTQNMSATLKAIRGSAVD